MKRNRTSREPRITRIGGRIEIIHGGGADFSLYVDAEYVGSFKTLNDAEQAGWRWINELAADMERGLKAA